MGTRDGKSRASRPAARNRPRLARPVPLLRSPWPWRNPRPNCHRRLVYWLRSSPPSQARRDSDAKRPLPSTQLASGSRKCTHHPPSGHMDPAEHVELDTQSTWNGQKHETRGAGQATALGVRLSVGVRSVSRCFCLSRCFVRGVLPVRVAGACPSRGASACPSGVHVHGPSGVRVLPVRKGGRCNECVRPRSAFAQECVCLSGERVCGYGRSFACPGAGGPFAATGGRLPVRVREVGPGAGGRSASFAVRPYWKGTGFDRCFPTRASVGLGREGPMRRCPCGSPPRVRPNKALAGLAEGERLGGR